MRTIVVITLLGLLSPAGAVLAGSKVTSGSAKATVTRAASAAEQLAIAKRLLQQMERTQPPEKLDLFAQAWGSLSLVRNAWPNDKEAVLRSGIMQADLAASFGLSAQEVSVLLEILPAARKTVYETEVEQKLGQAYDRLGNAADAEKHLLSAEQAMHGRPTSRVESEKILSTLGYFYARHNQPAGAIERFREAENLPGQDVVNKTHFQLAIAEQATHLGRDSAARELAAFDDLVAAARHTTLTPADATLISHMSQHAQRLRDAAHL